MPAPETASSPPSVSQLRPWALLLMLLLIVLSVLVPFLLWRGTWFGRPLTAEEIGKRLTDTKQPRKTQHALAQIAERILRGDPAVREWYPQVEALAHHPLPELRVTVAWVMGQDNRSEEFHHALVSLLEDPDVMVKRNAALSLVRFGDARGRAELLNMLGPYTLHAAQAGRLRVRLKAGDTLNPGTLVARLERSANDVFEVRSPLPGSLETWLADDGSEVRAGDALALLAPSPEQAWEALRALYFVGEPEDLQEVERFALGLPALSERIRQQARLTAQAIQTRRKTKAGAGQRNQD